MEVIAKKVLIKEATGGVADLIFSVKNLPKDLLFDKNGAIHRGIKRSQTGDNGFLFERYDREGDDRLKTLDRYIDAVWPRTKSLPKRIPNQSVIGLGSSPALTMSQMEERIEGDYGVRFLDLPIPRDEDVPSFENVSESKHVTKTFQDDGYYDPNQPPVVGPSRIASEVKTEPRPAGSKCIACPYIAKNNAGLAAHIRHKHKTSTKKEAAVPSG